MGFPGDYLLIAVRFAREVGSRLFGRDWPTLFTSRNRVLEARAKICVHLEIALAAPYAADFVLHFATMARFRSPEINHRHSPRLCADEQRRGIAAHPATRLMDLGRGLDPYTTRSPIAVRGSPTLVSDLNRAINNGGSLNVKSPTLKCANPAKLGALGGARQ